MELGYDIGPCAPVSSMSSHLLTYFASSPRHLESLLAKEMTGMGAVDVRKVSSGVQFTGDLEIAYRACLWSRVANRVLYPLGAGTVKSPEQLYTYIQSFNWSEHLTAEQTMAVDFYCANSKITHSQYGALKVKDAVVDQFREQSGVRPSVDRVTPDVRINVYLFRDRARVAIDLSGASLHRRGYRQGGDRAPLKENLAAALLLSLGWDELAQAGSSFYDPMCGSATLLIEAAMIASNTAPGINRDYYGFTGWKQHQPDLWQRVLQEAKAAASIGDDNWPVIMGSDRSAQAVAVAKENIAAAGFAELIKVDCVDIADVSIPDSIPAGLVLTNPPYGIRVEEQAVLGQLYSDMGTALKRGFPGWQVALFSGAQRLLFRTRLALEPVLQVDNGGIACKLVSGQIKIDDIDKDSASPQDNASLEEVPSSVWEAAVKRKSARPQTKNGAVVDSVATPVDNMFANRLRKNLRHLKNWVKREQISAYRVYDADMPEYAVAVDIYEMEPRQVVVQEYQAPSRVDEQRAADRLALVMATVPEVFGCSSSNVHLKVRKRQKGNDQYTRSSVHQREQVVHEFGCQLLVNVEDYLDTGLFLDHRKVRHYIQNKASGKRFLNLFAYTGAATVHAVIGGAASSLTIDMSNTYLDWAKRNILLNNGNPDQHRLLRADCTEWLAPSTDKGENNGPYDLILLDPPTFSNSARMEADWDVQRDHAGMIRQVMSVLAPHGLLIFSTNFRRFRLDRSTLSDFALEDRTSWSIDRDFQRNQRIHQCWFIRHT